MAKGRYRSRPSSASGGCKNPRGSHGTRQHRWWASSQKTKRKAETEAERRYREDRARFAVLLNLHDQPWQPQRGGASSSTEPPQQSNRPAHNRPNQQPPQPATTQQTQQGTTNTEADGAPTRAQPARQQETSTAASQSSSCSQPTLPSSTNSSSSSRGDRLMPLDSAVSWVEGGSRYIGSWGGVPPPRQLPPEQPVLPRPLPLPGEGGWAGAILSRTSEATRATTQSGSGVSRE